MKQEFTLWNNQAFTASGAGINANGTYELATSDGVNNAVGGFRSLKLIMEYSDISPDFGVNPQTFDIDSVVEGYNSNLLRWYPVAYQFTAYRNPMNGNTRIIQLQPSLSGFDAGVDDIMWVGDSTLARVSRQQGNLPDTQFRVRITVTERGYGGPGAFQSVSISAYGEAFDA